MFFLFAVCFFVWLCCEHLQCVSLFGCVVSICSVFVCLCCEYLQCVSLFGCVVSICSACVVKLMLFS